MPGRLACVQDNGAGGRRNPLFQINLLFSYLILLQFDYCLVLTRINNHLSRHDVDTVRRSGRSGQSRNRDVTETRVLPATSPVNPVRRNALWRSTAMRVLRIAHALPSRRPA
jgi:hypothetical protein